MDASKATRELAEELSRGQHAEAMAEADSWHPVRMHDLYLGNAPSPRLSPALVPVRRSTRRRKRQRGFALRMLFIVLALGLVGAFTLMH